MNNDDIFRSSVSTYLSLLNSSEYYDEDEGAHKFPSGEFSSICTVSARTVARRFDGVVYGYFHANNKAAQIGVPYCEGHDFAVVDERWVIDYWAKYVAGISLVALWDMRDPLQLQEVLHWFGERSKWEMLE